MLLTERLLQIGWLAVKLLLIAINGSTFLTKRMDSIDSHLLLCGVSIYSEDFS